MEGGGVVQLTSGTYYIGPPGNDDRLRTRLELLLQAGEHSRGRLAQRPRPRHPRTPAVTPGRDLDLGYPVTIGDQRLAQREVQVHGCI